jgi:radical SAM protein with 4Fe4S-binding SPASM domain
VAVDINSVLTRPGLPDVEKLLAFVQRRAIGQHRIVPQYPMGRGADTRWDELTPGQLLELDDNLHRATEALYVVPDENRTTHSTRASTSSKGVRRSHCGAGLSEVSVDPEGWVYPCKLLQYEQYRAANVRDRRLAEIFAIDPIIARFQRPFVNTLQPCTTCIIKNHCGGGCRGIHASFSNDWTIAEPLFCAQLRRSFELNVFATTGSVPPRQPARFIRSNGVSTALGISQENITFIPLAQVRRGLG